jgi:hypothetical protein
VLICMSLYQFATPLFREGSADSKGGWPQGEKSHTRISG